MWRPIEYSNRGNLFFDQGKLDEALNAFNKAQSDNTGSVAYASRAYVYHYQKRYNESIRE